MPEYIQLIITGFFFCLGMCLFAALVIGAEHILGLGRGFTDKSKHEITTTFSNFSDLSPETIKNFEQIIYQFNSGGGGFYEVSSALVDNLIAGNKVKYIDLEMMLKGHSYGSGSNNKQFADAIAEISDRMPFLEQERQILIEKRKWQNQLERLIGEQDMARRQLIGLYCSVLAAALSAFTGICILSIELLRFLSEKN